MAKVTDEKPTHHPDWPKRLEGIMAGYPTEDSPGDGRLHPQNMPSTLIKSSPEFKELMTSLLEQFKEPSKAALKELESFAVNILFNKLFGSTTPAATGRKK